MGLCFNCNDKFTPGHKCQGSQLMLLEMEKTDGGTHQSDSDEEKAEKPFEDKVLP